MSDRLSDYNRWKTNEPDSALPGGAPADSPDEALHKAFLLRWEELRTPGGHYIARCKRCGFDVFTWAHATIEKHDKTCRASTRGEST